MWSVQSWRLNISNKAKILFDFFRNSSPPHPFDPSNNTFFLLLFFIVEKETKKEKENCFHFFVLVCFFFPVDLFNIHRSCFLKEHVCICGSMWENPPHIARANFAGIKTTLRGSIWMHFVHRP